MKKPTQADIAKALGVSPATVALVVGNSNSALRHRLSPATILRIEEKARELGYSPHRGAQMMRQGRSNLIVLLNSGGYSELVAKRVFHIGRIVHEIGYDFHVVEAYWWNGDAEAVIERIIGLRPEGLVIVGSFQSSFWAPHMERLFQQGIAVVTLGLELPKVPCIRHDVHTSVYRLTKWCLEQNRKNIVLLLRHSLNPTWQTLARIEGFERAVKECTGLTPVTQVGLSEQTDRSDAGRSFMIALARSKREAFQPFNEGIEAMTTMAGWRSRPDAILCTNDEFAIGALSVCASQNITVPDEIMLSGFDNLSHTALGPVPLTSVEQPIEAACEVAIEILQKNMGKQNPPVVGRRILPCEIIWRKSTAGPSLAGAQGASLTFQNPTQEHTPQEKETP